VSTGSADCAFHHGGVVQGLVAVTAVRGNARINADIASASIDGASAVPAGATLVVVRSSRPWLAPPPGPPPSSHRPLVLRI
jgi:hypothetical protein